MTRLQFLKTELRLVLTMLGLIFVAELLTWLGEHVVANIMWLLAGSISLLITIAMLVSDEGRELLHNQGK